MVSKTESLLLIEGVGTADSLPMCAPCLLGVQSVIEGQWTLSSTAGEENYCQSNTPAVSTPDTCPTADTLTRYLPHPTRSLGGSCPRVDWVLPHPARAFGGRYRHAESEITHSTTRSLGTVHTSL